MAIAESTFETYLLKTYKHINPVTSWVATYIIVDESWIAAAFSGTLTKN